MYFSPVLRKVGATLFAGTVLAVVALTGGPRAIGADALMLYVAPKGIAEADIPADRVFATLEAARDAIRSLRRSADGPAGPITVVVAAGHYYRDASFVLTEADGGREGAPVTYVGDGTDDTRLMGGRPLAPALLRPVTDPGVLERIVPAARQAVRRIDPVEAGIGPLQPLATAFRGHGGGPELFWNGLPLDLAAWPNDDWALTGAVVDAGGGDQGGAFRFGDLDRPLRWRPDAGVWLQGYWRHDWYEETIRIASIDRENRSIRLAAPHLYGLAADQRWRAINVLEELDKPGEWAMDVASGQIYLWPPGPVDAGSLFLSTLTEPLVRISGASNLRLRNLIFDGGLATACVIEGGSDIVIEASVFRNQAGGAVDVDGATSSGLSRCQIRDVGAWGVRLNGGDRRTLTPGRLFVEDCDIHRFGRLQRTYAGAIHLSGVGARVAHNLIHNAPHAGILFGGNDHVIEFNEVFHVGRESGDVGALYSGRDWTSYGNIIRHNFIHHVTADGKPHGAIGVYLDDCASGDLIEGNVFCRIDRAVLIGGGRDNTVRNNTFIDCDVGVHVDDRGKTRIVFGDRADTWNLEAKALAVGYRQPPWSERYPTLAAIMDNRPTMPLGNVVEGNLVVNCPVWVDLRLSEPALVTVRDNWQTDEDPGFTDYDALHFELAPDSVVFDNIPGFEAIPVTAIGIRR